MSNRPPVSPRFDPVAIVLLAATLLISGCLDWSGDVAKYRAVLNSNQATTQPSAWGPTDPLPLHRALQLADADNEAIGVRGEDYAQALAEKMRQAGTLLPTLTLSPSHTLSGGNSVGIVSGSASSIVESTGGTSHQFTAPLTLSETGSLSEITNVQSAGRTVQQQAQLLLDERETVLLQVVQSYYAALKAEHQAGVYASGLALKTEKVRDQQVRLKLGNVRPLDLAQSESDLADTQASLVQAQTDAADARSALARLMGVPAVRGPLSDSFNPPGDLAPLDTWQRQAMAGRQDLRAAEQYLESSRLSLRSAMQEYFPSLSVNLQRVLYTDPTNIQSWSAVFSANVPIFSALSIEADVRKAWSIFRQAALTESQTRRQVVDDVNEYYQNLTGSRRRTTYLQVEVEAAERAYVLSDRSYRLGSDTNLDRLTQENNLLTAQLNLVSEQFNTKSYYLGLLRASGQLATALQ